MNKLTRAQWEELNAQLSSASGSADAEDVPGEHWKLIALLNCFGFYPVSKREALQLAERLLAEGWNDNP